LVGTESKTFLIQHRTGDSVGNSAGNCIQFGKKREDLQELKTVFNKQK
jgi:hypothetical protein